MNIIYQTNFAQIDFLRINIFINIGNKKLFFNTLVKKQRKFKLICLNCTLNEMIVNLTLTDVCVLPCLLLAQKGYRAGTYELKMYIFPVFIFIMIYLITSSGIKQERECHRRVKSNIQVPHQLKAYTVQTLYITRWRVLFAVYTDRFS